MKHVPLLNVGERNDPDNTDTTISGDPSNNNTTSTNYNKLMIHLKKQDTINKQLWWLQFHRYCSMILLLLTCCISILLCPYTKVEESFNIQASYDLLYYGYGPAIFGNSLSNAIQMTNLLHNITDDKIEYNIPYDHIQYPGVVSRTFLGSIFITCIVQMIRYCIYYFPYIMNLVIMNQTKMLYSYDILNSNDFNHIILIQYLIRFILMLLIYYYGWILLINSIDIKLKQKYSMIGSMILYITSCQFHITYYSSRLLPNTFALLITLRSYTHWIYADYYRNEYNIECNNNITSSEDNTTTTTNTTTTNNNNTNQKENNINNNKNNNNVNKQLYYFQMCCSLFDLLLGMFIFRCDLLLLVGCIGLTWWLLLKQITIIQSISVGIFFIIFILPFTIFIDSILWNNNDNNNNTNTSFWLWPELSVFYFNVILNKSSQYGISPYYWYFTSALPKSLLFTLFFVPIGIIKFDNMNHHTNQTSSSLSSSSSSSSSSMKINNNKYKDYSLLFQYLINRFPYIDYDWISYFIPAIGFVLLYSYLGHKEVRFLYPVIPLFNIIAGVGLYKIYKLHDNLDNTNINNQDITKMSNDIIIKENPKPPKSVIQMKRQQSKSYRYSIKFIYFIAIISLVLSYIATWIFIIVSSHNYPGGYALQNLIAHVQNQPKMAFAGKNTTTTDENDNYDISSLATTTSSSYNMKKRNKILMMVHVYIDNSAAMTGITLFLQRHATTMVKHIEWKFTKEGYEIENQLQKDDDNNNNNNKWYLLNNYTHLIMNSNDISDDILNYYRIIHIEKGYPRLNVKKMIQQKKIKELIHTSDAITVLQKIGSWNNIIIPP